MLPAARILCNLHICCSTICRWPQDFCSEIFHTTDTFSWFWLVLCMIHEWRAVPGSQEPAGRTFLMDESLVTVPGPAFPECRESQAWPVVTISRDFRQFPESSQALQSDTLSFGDHSLDYSSYISAWGHSLYVPGCCFETFILILLSTPTAVSDPEKPVSFHLIHLPLSGLWLL